MREVSCRIFEPLVRCAEQNNLSLEEFTRGLIHDPRIALDPNERVDWEVLLGLIERLRPFCPTREHWVNIGRQIFISTRLGALTSVMRVLRLPRIAAKWALQYGGHRNFSNMTTKLMDVNSTLFLELSIADGYARCPEYFYICEGVFGAMPTLLGAEEVPVELELIGNTGKFAIHYEAIESGRWQWRDFSNPIRRFRRIFQPRQSMIAEYEQQQLLLENKYVDLEKAKSRIESQQKTIELVHSITSTTHQNLRLGDTVEVISRQLSQRLSYDYVEVKVDAEQDGVHVAQVARLGVEANQAHHHELLLTSRNGGLGAIRVGREKNEITDSDRQLLSLVTEAVTVGIENAVSYEVIASYRNDLEQKVATRTSELAEAREQLERSLESRNQFFSNVNHDLRSPLMAMLLVIQRIAQNPNLNADAKRSLEQAQANAQRMKDLVEDLLSLASGSEGKRVEMVQVDAATMLEHIGNALRPVAESKNLELKIEVEPGLVFDANAKQIERAYSNLADNALKYTDAGSVTLRASAHDDGVVLAVTDTGPGIPKDYVEKVFNRFVQVPRAKASPGAGIGLALVREIAIQNGGNVGLESEVGRGSTFFIRLPKKSGGLRKRVEPKVQTLQFDASKPSTKAERLFPTSVKLLICEDDPGLAQQLSDFFTENGLEVTRAANGEEALEIAAKKPPALLLTDIDLGTGIDGLELCRRFRALPNHHNAAAIVLTADTRRQLVTALDAGAVDFLRKPVNLNELAARVRAQLAYRRLAMRLLESEKMAAHASALTGLAHELRNPLNGLINAVAPLKELISVGDDTRTANDLLDVIEECGRRVASLAHQLLNYSPDQAVPNERVPVVEIVSQAVKVIRPKVNDRRLTTTIRYQGSILGSSEQLSQIVINLLDNAAYAAGPGGLISVATELEGDNVVVEVSDSGPGIEPELQERVFEPFFTTKAAGEGVGLGLAISRDIARRHSGDLVIRPGRPFAMRLTLPRVADEIAGA